MSKGNAVFGKADAEALSRLPDLQMGGLVRGRLDRLKMDVIINTPEACAGIESFAAGGEFTFAYWYDEIHVGVSGRAKVSYSLPPYHNKIEEREVGPGDMYLIPNGSRWWFEAGPDEPFVHTFMVLPNPFFEEENDE